MLFKYPEVKSLVHPAYHNVLGIKQACHAWARDSVMNEGTVCPP